MKKLIFLTVFLCITSLAHADYSIQKVEISPLTDGISFNTVTTNSVCGWVTASSVMRGRKEVIILNTSTSENIFLTGVSGSTAIGTLYPREAVTFKASSGLNIYVSANSVTAVEVQCWEIR